MMTQKISAILHAIAFTGIIYLVLGAQRIEKNEQSLAKMQAKCDSLIQVTQKLKSEKDSLTKVIKTKKKVTAYSTPKRTYKVTKRSGSVNSYIEKYLCYAQESQRLYGVPVSITLAQGILESACGQSNYALNRNNHFGIKMGTQYRFFDSVEACFQFHAKLLSKRYKVPTMDYIKWAHNLEKKGYATDPLYAEKLIAKIQQNNLMQYDA